MQHLAHETGAEEKHTLCRERRLMAVQTTYGVLLPPDVMHSSSDMSTTLMLSDTAHITASMGSGSLEFASDFPADAESDAQPLMFGSYEEDAEQVGSVPVHPSR